MVCYNILYRFLAGSIIQLIFQTTAFFGIYSNYLKNPKSNFWEPRINFTTPASQYVNTSIYGTDVNITANNITLHVVDTDKGNTSKPLMLCVHGYPEIWYSFRYQMNYFRSTFRVVSMDMRGYGQSDKPSNQSAYTLANQIGDIKAIIEASGYKKAVILAHDLGGVLSCRFRDVYPEYVSGLVLLASTSLEAWFENIWGTNEQRLKSGYVFRNQVPFLNEALITSSNYSLLSDINSAPGKNSSNATDILYYKYFFSKTNGLYYPVNFYRANFLYCWDDVVHNESVPMIHIVPSNDPFLSRNILTVMKKSYPNLETSVVRNSTHFLHIDDSTVVNPIIETFCNKYNLTKS